MSELLDPGLLLVGYTLCRRYGGYFFRVGRWRRGCYPFYLHRRRLETWQGRYPRSRSI